MIERIRELAKQAGFRSDVTVTDGNNKRIDTKTSISLEKFAELIIRECANIADEPTSRPFDSYGKKIKKHFGVE